MSTPDARPVLRLVRGAATLEELAAVVTVLLVRTGPAGTPPAAPAPRSAWRGSVALRRTLVPGPGAWRASGLPGG